MAAERVVLGFEAEGTESTAKKIEQLEKTVADLKKQVEKLSGEPLEIPTDPAVEDLKKLKKELAGLEREFDSARRSVDKFENELDVVDDGLRDTSRETKKLADANKRLAARGQALIKFSKALPPELRKVATGLDRVEKEARQAERAFTRLSKVRKPINGLVSTIGQLRTTVGALVAFLGVQQLIRFGRALISMGASAVETKQKFDALLPGLRAFTGSTELAEEVADRLAETSEKLKTPLADLIQPFLRISAATKETNLTLAEQADLFESALLTVRAFGLGTQETSRLITGFAQVAGKGCVDDEVQILTCDGWKHHPEIAIGVSVAQFEDGATVWGDLRAIHVYPNEKAPVLMAIQGTEIAMTGNHRVLTLEGIVESRDLAGRDVLIPTPKGPAWARFTWAEGAYGVWCPETSTGTWLARKGPGQFYTGNSLQMEELRQQIGEVAFNALPALSKALGISLPQLFEDVAAGAVDAETALRGLATGLREANEAAGLAQLDTLRGDLGEFARVTENAERALADGLEPGLRSLIVAATEFLETNQDLIAGLGGLGAAALKGLGFVVKGAEGVALGLKAAVARTEEFGQELIDLNAIGLGLIGEKIRGIGRALKDSGDEAEKFIDDATEGFRRLLNAGAATSEEILEDFRKSFREQAAAAGASAEDIAAIETDLADRVGKIQEETLEFRKSLTREAAADIRDFGEVQVETAERIANLLGRILEASVDERAKLEAALLEETARVTAERIAAEKRAAAEALKAFAVILEGSKKLAAGQIAEAAKASTFREKTALELVEKLAKIEDDFLEKLKNPKVDRAELDKETSDKIVAARRAASDALIKEEERVAEAAEKAAERRIKAEESARAAITKTIEEFQKFIDQQEELEGDDGERGDTAIGQLADDAEELPGLLGDVIISLQEMNKEFDRLKGTPDQILDGLIGDLDFATAGFATVTAGTSELDEGLDSNREAASRLGRVLADALSRIGDLGPAAAENLRLLQAEFEDLRAAGQLTAQGIDTIAGDLAASLTKPIDPAQQLRDAIDNVGDTTGLDDVKGSAEGAGTALEGTGTAAEGAGVGILTMADGTKVLIGELEKVEGEDAAEEIKTVGAAAEDSGKNVITLADGTKIVVEEFGKVGDKGKNAAEGIKLVGEASEEAEEPVKKLGEAAGTAAEPVGKLATEAERLKGDIIDEEEPAKIAALGEAAETAKEPVTLLAEPVEKIRLSSDGLAVSLPVIAAALAEVQPALEGILAALEANPVDLDQLGIQVQAIAVPLETIAEAIAGLLTSVQALPAPLQETLAAAQPLFDLVLEALGDGRFLELASALERIADAVPKIPGPLEEIKTAFEAIANVQESVVGALGKIKGALESVAAEKILTAISALKAAIGELEGVLSSAAKKAEALSKGVDKVTKSLPKTTDEASKLSTELTTSLVPALDAVTTKAGEIEEELRDLKETIAEAQDAIVEFGTETEKAMNKATAGVKALNDELRKTPELAAAAAAAMAAIEPPGVGSP